MESLAYYVIVGTNGVAVMDTLAGAKRLEKYIREPKIQGFSDFTLAEFWALATFQQKSPAGKYLNYLPLNRAIFSKDVLGGKLFRRKSHE